MAVRKADCVAAGLSVGGRLRNGKLVEGRWHHVSVGCSLQGDGVIHYNTKVNAQNTGGFIPVCKKASKLPSSMKFCPSSIAVSKEDCVAAGLSVGGKLRNGQLVEGRWEHVSVGCSLQGNGDIHYNTKVDAKNTYGFIPVCKPFSFDASCYFCDKKINTMFILMTHNSFANPWVDSPNQNHRVGRQFRDGIRGFQFDIYWKNGKIIMKHGGSSSVDYSTSVEAIVTEMNKWEYRYEFVLVQFEDYVGRDRVDKVLEPWGDKLIKDFNPVKKLGDYIIAGKRVLLTSKYQGRESKGMHYYEDLITENRYQWFSATENVDFRLRRGPRISHTTAKMMNHFCGTWPGAGSMVSSAIVNTKSRMLYDARIFKKQYYAMGKINIMVIDYYDTGDVFAAQRAIRRGDFNSGCWSNGKLCGIGSTCYKCCSKHEYWYKKAMTACGREPCWRKNKVCGQGTTCNACCNGSRRGFIISICK